MLGRNSTARIRTALRWLQHLYNQMHELEERRLLLNCPWEEDFLHWIHDGRTWYLHGHLAPPKKGSCRSTTRNCWCPVQGVGEEPGEIKRYHSSLLFTASEVST